MLNILKTFYRFILEKKGQFSVVLILVILGSILGSVTPYFLKLFVEAIPTLNYQRMIVILLFYFGFNIISLILEVASGWIGDSVLFGAAKHTRQEIFKHVQDLDFAFHSEKSTGSLISAFKRGDGAFFNLYQIIHFRFLDVIVSTAVMLYFFTRIDILITAVIVISFAITLYITKVLVMYNVKKRNEFNSEEDKVSGIITDNMMNYETVKLFAQEKAEQGRLEAAFTPWILTLWGYGNSFRLIDISIGLVTNISIFLVFLLAIGSVTSLKIGVGDFVLIIGFIGAFFPKIWNLVWSARDIAKNYADIERYFGLLDFDIQVKDPENPVLVKKVRGEINFNNISFKYTQKNRNAIHAFDLKVEPGESIALVGRSGSGKTSLVKLLMRFYDLQNGSITIDNIDIKNFTKSGLRSLVGVVPQEPILFNNTIAYNIGYGYEGRSTPQEVKSAAKMANIDEFIESLPEKYETEVGERGVKLSGGQKQRLAIARMILSDPDIVVFDEATSHLDSESEKLIQEAFWKARAGKTTIIIAHRLSTVMRADKIVVMESGKIKEVGTHESLLEKKGSLYSHFWNLQIKLD